jgi:hypothetical protein
MTADSSSVGLQSANRSLRVSCSAIELEARAARGGEHEYSGGGGAVTRDRTG